MSSSRIGLEESLEFGFVLSKEKKYKFFAWVLFLINALHVFYHEFSHSNNDYLIDIEILIINVNQ